VNGQHIFITVLGIVPVGETLRAEPQATLSNKQQPVLICSQKHYVYKQISALPRWLCV